VSSRETWRQGSLALHVVGPTDDDVFVTAAVEADGCDAAEAASRFYGQIAELLTARPVQVVHERLFGSLSVRTEVLEARRHALGQGGVDPEGPITFIQGQPAWGQGLAGLQLYLVRPDEGTQVETVCEDGVPCGRAWVRSGARFLVLQDMCAAPADLAGNGPTVQAERMFARAEGLLRAHGATYADVVRTWIYLSRILEWYDEFNQARNSAYERFGLIGAQRAMLPASTGIEGDNAHGAAGTMDLVAVWEREKAPVEVSYLGNVRQADAFDYGSAFSRGACIQESHVRHVHISGTAAVDEQGRTLHVGDVRRQITSTADSVRSLIGQEGAALGDICQATMFLKRSEDYEVFRSTARECGLADIPAVYVRADVCRAEWLFEMDGMAALPVTG